MLLDLFKIIIILLFFLIAAIIGVKYIKTGRTFQEATKICVDFLKNIFREFFGMSAPIKPNYPVFIGYNGYDIISRNVERSFQDLSKYFEVFYFDYYNNTLANRIIYRFKVSNPNTEMDFYNFTELIQKVVEKILVQHLRNQDVDIPCDNFVAIKLDGDILYVSIAKNDIGIIETKNIRRKIKADYYSSQHKDEQAEILTDWSDNEHQ